MSIRRDKNSVQADLKCSQHGRQRGSPSLLDISQSFPQASLAVDHFICLLKRHCRGLMFISPFFSWSCPPLCLLTSSVAINFTVFSTRMSPCYSALMNTTHQPWHNNESTRDSSPSQSSGMCTVFVQGENPAMSTAKPSPDHRGWPHACPVWPEPTFPNTAPPSLRCFAISFQRVSELNQMIPSGGPPTQLRTPLIFSDTPRRLKGSMAPRGLPFTKCELKSDIDRLERSVLPR